MLNKRHELLEVLKRGESLSAQQLEVQLGISPEYRELAVRRIIDYWRAKNEPIWHDGNGRFWWGDDEPVRPRGTQGRWKLPFGELSS